ncbi:metalloregulator ArsR/SmtB family transcription factor [Rossellomorea aquimaris]|uniref:Cadmium-sensing regulator CadC n=1 Tax=Rossellomorea aquimaris TaxID=189382 RepID=A0A366ET46_9BACI|nr:metalloregulator ArsR/SmtB family transcription factor [Rossellomorea aquimaris]RBP05567.1 cadmium-sensing regulator CadC [Rossellomorea aquimaris]
MKHTDMCEINCIDNDKVSRIKKNIQKQNTLNIAQMFKALSDDTRLKIAYALSLEKELCVCDVANIVGSTTATASHHLRLLRNLGLAQYRKEGKLVYYSLVDEHMKNLIQISFEHSRINESLRG